MFTTNSDPVEALVQRFGIRGRTRSAATGMGWLGALSPVRLAVDEAIVRQVRAHAPPEGLQSMLAAMQLEVEKFLGCGGKRLRAVALLSAYAAWADESDGRDELAIDAAAAIEVLHGFMLAHDDIVDRSAWRRGEPTLHVRLATAAAGDRHSPLGADLSLIAGDILFAQANRHMMLAPWPEAARAGIFEDWCAMVLDTGYGQWADTLNDSSSLLRLTSKQILEIARTKTALYTLAGPMRIGARLAGASPGAIAALTRYGTALGTAFQIRDDLIDICDGRSLGKDFADDLRRGRISVPIAVALERASGSDRDRLRALCSGDEGVSVSARRSWVLQLLDRTDALAATQRMMNDEVDAAVSALAGLDTPQALLWKKLALSISEEAGRALDRSTLAPVLAQAVSA